MRRRLRPRSAPVGACAAAAAALLSGALAACTSGSGSAVRVPSAPVRSSSVLSSPPGGPTSPGSTADPSGPGATDGDSVSDRPPTGRFTMAFAGDVHFSGRVAARLAHPATVFAQAAAGLGRADVTMVNLETAITTGGVPQNKAFTFRAPPVALTALRDAGVDVATMANNHGADYGLPGLRDTFRAVRGSRFPIVGIGHDAAAAFAPWTTTVHGVRLAVFAADQVRDETTLPLFSAGRAKPGVADACDPRLERAVRGAVRHGFTVVVYVHWGIELDTCPSPDQQALAARLAAAGASAVIGTHAHVLQGAGWLPDGTYVEYGLGNYLWWESFGNIQDDNGLLTLRFDRRRVTAAHFAPSHLDARGVPVPSTGTERARIAAQWRGDRSCTGLSARPPR